MQLQQNTPEWLEWRHGKIGASDAPVIMGVSPWKTPYQLWEEKLKIRAQGPKSAAMNRGNEMEETALCEFMRMTGLIACPMIVQHPDYEWMVASLDGMDSQGTFIVEIKCPGKADHETALKGQIPDKYIPQIQHQLEVTGAQKGYYFSFDGEAGCIVEFGRDEGMIEDIICKELQFWECMQSLVPPATCERDYVERDDDVWNSCSYKWRVCYEQLQTLKAKEEELRDTLVTLSGRNNCVGGGIKISRVVRKGNIDYTSIPQLETVDLERYRKAPIESWRISHHD